MSETNIISLKLLVDKNSKKVVFAEASKDFVDFLFGLLELPLGSILSLLIQHGVAGSCSLGRVYESAKNLDPSYLQPGQTKNFLQRPSSSTKQTYLLDKFVYNRESSSPSFSSSGSFGSSPAFASSSSAFVSSSPGFSSGIPSFSSCGSFGSSPFASSSPALGSSLAFASSSPEFGSNSRPAFWNSPSISSHSSKEKEVDGYVKAAVVYMVMDDLTVKPMSTISSITLFNTIGVKDMSSVQEKIVEINMKKALEMVKTSFESTTVLSDVFIGKEPPVDCNSESQRENCDFATSLVSTLTRQ